MTLVFAAVLTPTFALAENENSNKGNVGIIAYVLGAFLSVILTFTAYLLEWTLRFSNEMIGLNAVSRAWGIVLSFANLGFVLAIIVIAFATMLRMESYGMKKTLWKLIVAALLVNFSLVIAGAFISASAMASNIFLKSLEFDTLSVNLANAIQPQQWGNIENSGNWTEANSWILWLIGGSLKWIISLLFSIIFTFLTILAFAGLTIMFLIRAIALLLLLIISPLAWLAWILPSTEQYWKQWWQEFIRWCFFAPACLFFVYAAILIAGETKTLSNFQSSSDLQSSIDKTLLFNSNFINHLVNLFIILAIIYGGIYIANKFGIAGGGLAYGWAQGAGKYFGGWARNKGARLGTLPLRGERGRKFIEKTQKGENWIGKIPLVGKRIGHGLSRVGVMKGEDLFKQAEERFKNLNDKQVALRVSTMSRDERAAALARLAKNGNIGFIPEGAEKYIKDEKTKKIFESYGKGKEYGDFEKAAGINTAAANATGAKKLEELKKHYRTYKPEEFSKAEKSMFFDDKKHPDADIHLNALIDTNPGALGKLFSRLNGDELEKINNKIIENIKANLPDEFYGDIGKGKKEEIKRFSKGYLLTKGSQEEVQEGIMAYLKKNKKDIYSAYTKHLANRLHGFEYKEFKEKTES